MDVTQKNGNLSFHIQVSQDLGRDQCSTLVSINVAHRQKPFNGFD